MIRSVNELMDSPRDLKELGGSRALVAGECNQEPNEIRGPIAPQSPRICEINDDTEAIRDVMARTPSPRDTRFMIGGRIYDRNTHEYLTGQILAARAELTCLDIRHGYMLGAYRFGAVFYVEQHDVERVRDILNCYVGLRNICSIQIVTSDHLDNLVKK